MILMTDAQLYLAVGIPSFALVLGMIGNGLCSMPFPLE
jgi:hypothetical protein